MLFRSISMLKYLFFYFYTTTLSIHSSVSSSQIFLKRKQSNLVVSKQSFFQMAPNKFASMVHRNTNRLTLILVYVLLEWILIAMILLNSLYSYLIVKYADYFGLKRPCILCSRIDRGKDKKVRLDVICEEHALEISELGFCQRHQTLVKCGQTKSMCQNCSPLQEPTLSDLMCSCCNDRLEDKPPSPVSAENRESHFFDLAVVDEHHEKLSEEQSIEQQEIDQVLGEEDTWQLVSAGFVLSGDDADVSESLAAESDQDSAQVADTESRGFYAYFPDTADAPVADIIVEAQAQVRNNGGDHESDSSECSDALMETEDHEKAQKQSSDVIGNESNFDVKLETESSELARTVENLTRELNGAYAELDQGRNDAAEASSLAMAMINKLQEEKAALQLEASQYQRMTGEQIAFDQEAGLLLDESSFEVKTETGQQENGLSAASTIEKLTRALNEAYAELEQERNDAAEASFQTMEMITKLQEEKAALQLEASQYQRMADEQIAFDEEAVLLLDEMVRRREKENQELEKELEMYKRRFAENEKMRRSEEDRRKMFATSESVSVCYSSFGDQDSDGVSIEDDEHHQHRVHLECDDPPVDSEDERLSILDRLNELEQKLVDVSKGEESCVEEKIVEDGMKCGIEEEEKEFMIKCMKSVKRGDEGMSVVQEILQHLRALRRLDKITLNQSPAFYMD